MPRTADKFAFFVEMAKQQDENKYTDAQLCELMTEHFPNFAGPHMIPGYRRAYNLASKPGFEAPATPLLAYDAEGNAIPEGKRKSPEAKAKAKAEKAPADNAPADGDDAADKAEFEKIKENAAKAKAKKTAAAKAKAAPAKAAPAAQAKKLVIKKK
jgi:hypothetical protein